MCFAGFKENKSMYKKALNSLLKLFRITE